MNNQNLKPYSASSVSEARENGKIGGIKSGESRRKRIVLKETLNDLLGMEPSEGEIIAALDDAGLPHEHQYAIALAAIRRAERGDIEASRFIRDSIGQKPSEKLDVASTLLEQPVESLDLSQLSDEQLYAMMQYHDPQGAEALAKICGNRT